MCGQVRRHIAAVAMGAVPRNGALPVMSYSSIRSVGSRGFQPALTFGAIDRFHLPGYDFCYVATIEILHCAVKHR
jgi:hypothetical protein